MMSNLLFATTLALVAAMAFAQTCPCRFEEGRTCNSIIPNPAVPGTCLETLVDCPCYCTYDGTATDTCVLAEGLGYVFVDEPFCVEQGAAVPICNPPEPEFEERIYVCVDSEVLNGLGTLECTIPALPCETITEATLTFWQNANYKILVTFGQGWTSFDISLKTLNVPDPVGWFVGPLPGVNIIRPGNLLQGPVSVVKEYDENATSLTAPATNSYVQTLINNCETAPTSFLISVNFDISNRGATFDDTPPLYGVTTTTWAAIVVKVLIPI